MTAPFRTEGSCVRTLLVIQRHRMHFSLTAACGGRSLWFVDQQVVTIEFTMEQYLLLGSKKMA